MALPNWQQGYTGSNSGSMGNLSGGGSSTGSMQPGTRASVGIGQGYNTRRYSTGGLGNPGGGNNMGAPQINPQNQPQMPYNPNAPQAQGMMNTLSQSGSGLLDPNSAYSKRMRGEIQQDIGQQTEAKQRSAALMAARSGMGAGASPELLETQGDLGQEGLRAAGDATAQAMLGGIQLGGNQLSQAMGGQLGLQGQQLQGYMGQQNIAAGQAQTQAQIDMQAQQQQNDLMMRELAMIYGMY